MLFGSADPELHEAAPESKGAPGLQSSAGTQLEAQSQRAKLWGPAIVVETRQYFSLLQKQRLPNKPFYNPISSPNPQ